MTEDAPFPAGEKAREKPAKKNPQKEPTVWLRDTPMGRQEIIDECQGLPDHYVQNAEGKDKHGNPAKWAGKPIAVAPQCVKAVLRCIAGWDAPGSTFFRSNENIAHCTGWPRSTVNKANLALKQAGLLTKWRPGMVGTSRSSLNWEALQRLRQRYVRPAETRHEKLPTPSDDPGRDQDNKSLDTPDSESVAARPDDLDPLTGEVLDRFAGLSMTKLPPENIQRLITQLRKLHSDPSIEVAIHGLDKRQIGSIIRAANPAGYLRTVLLSAIQDSTTPPEADDDEQADDQRYAEYFANFYNGSKPGQNLRSIFSSAITSPNLIRAMRYAFAKDGAYYRGVPLEQAARTFLKQSQAWILKYQNEFPDGSELDDEDEDDE
jgi:hypothetical protein